MCKLLERQSRVVDVGKHTSRRRDNQVGEIGKQRSLHRIGDFLREVDGPNILSAEGSERGDDFVDLLRKLAGRNEDETGCGFQRRIILYFALSVLYIEQR